MIDHAWPHVALTTVPVLAIGASAMIYRWNQQRLKHAKPVEALLSELCLAHGMNESMSRICAALAFHSQLKTPAILFVSPVVFDNAVAVACATKSFRKEQLASIESIRCKLFSAI